MQKLGCYYILLLELLFDLRVRQIMQFMLRYFLLQQLQFALLQQRSLLLAVVISLVDFHHPVGSLVGTQTHLLCELEVGGGVGVVRGHFF